MMAVFKEADRTGELEDFDMYATGSDAESGSWALLGKVSGKAKGKRVQFVGTAAEAKVKKMSAQERAALLAALQGYGGK